MTFTVSAKLVLAKLVGWTRIPASLIRQKAGNRFVILMYHRVLPPERIEPWVQAGMYVHPETFEMHLRYLKEKFRIVSLEEKFSKTNGSAKEKELPECVITFDDGWLDFYEFAYPILKRHRVPATVFLPTRYIGTSDWFWTDRLAMLLATEISVSEGKGSKSVENVLLLKDILKIRGPAEKRIEAAISILKGRSMKDIEDIIRGLETRAGTAVCLGQRAFLNWAEVLEMKDSGLVSFGSHTHNHKVLVHLEEKEIAEELLVSMKILLQKYAVNPACIPFCYPNGNFNERIADMVREARYRSAASTEPGWNTEGECTFRLKRIAIHQDMSATRGMFECRIAGML